MLIVKAKATRDMSGHSFVDHTYRECDFREATARNAHLEDAIFEHCDFRGMDLRRAVFRLSCLSGANNQIDDVTAASFLYWFNHFFDLPQEFKSQIEALVKPYKRKLAVMFAEEL